MEVFLKQLFKLNTTYYSITTFLLTVPDSFLTWTIYTPLLRTGKLILFEPLPSKEVLRTCFPRILNIWTFAVPLWTPTIRKLSLVVVNIFTGLLFNTLPVLRLAEAIAGKTSSNTCD